MLTVLPLGWVFYTHGTLAAEAFITVIILSLGMSAPIAAAFNFVDTLAQVGTTVAQVDEILNAEEQVHSETPVTFSDHTVVLKDVRFGYHADQEILHGVRLTIPQNKMTALVGTSGGGKSTIAKLAAGFWDAGSGSITMGGHELKDIPLTQLYDQVAFVSQDNYLFDDTVRENIRMGRRAPPTPRWRRPRRPQAAAASSAVLKTALTRWWAAAACTSRAASGSASPF